MELDNNRKVEIIIGLFLLGGIITWLVIPMSFQDTTIILQGGNGGGNSTGAVTSVNATSPIVSSGGTTPNISCPSCVTTTDTYTLLDTSSPINGTTTWTSGTFTAKKYLRVELEIQGYDNAVTAGNLGIRFNGDAGNNYNYNFNNRDSISSATDANQCILQQVDERFMYYGIIEILNQSDKWKVYESNIASSNHASQAGNGFFLSYCGYQVSNNPITSITLLRTSGTYALDSTSVMKVWGHD